MSSEISSSRLMEATAEAWRSVVARVKGSKPRRTTTNWPQVPPDQYQTALGNMMYEKDQMNDLDCDSSLDANDDDDLLPRSACTENELSIKSSTRRSLLATFLWRALVIYMAVFLTGCGVGFLSSLSTRKPTRVPQNCGNSTAEAAALGCKFDPMSGAWLPEICRDDELSADFDRAGPGGSWKYYANENLTEEISREEVALIGDQHGKAHFYVSDYWHQVHCHYYWRKQFRAPKLGKIVEPRYDTMEHVKHCWDMFTNEEQRGTFTRVGVIFETC